jgi:hypothetical protein
MKAFRYKNFNKMIRQKHSIRLFTRHYDGDTYDGIVLAANPELIILRQVDDFILGGVIAIQTRFLKAVRLGPNERVWDKIIAHNGQIKKLKRIPWLLKVENIRQLIKECHRRKIWPIVETQANKINAFYIGPVTRIGEKDFDLFCYDTHGKWEKNYRLNYKEVIRIEIFDNYSKYFNRYMSKKVPKQKSIK